MSVLIAILIVFLVITIHEAGHGIAAYAFGIKPEGIFIGLPIPPNIQFETKGGTKVVFSPWLIGGGVQLDPDKVSELPFIKQVAIFIAGPMFNLFTGIATAVLYFEPQIGLSMSRELAYGSTESIRMLSTGEAGFKDLSGPVGIVQTGSQIVQVGFKMGSILFWLILNFVVGIFNLVPIPGLDGGNIFVYAINKASNNSKKVEKITKSVRLAFTFLLVIGLITITAKDIANLIK